MRVWTMRDLPGLCLMFLLFCCIGCDDANVSAEEDAIEVSPQPGIERCEREGHQYFPFSIESVSFGKNSWECTQVICLRCLKRVKV